MQDKHSAIYTTTYSISCYNYFYKKTYRLLQSAY